MATRSLTYSTGYTLKTVIRDFSTGTERLWNTGTSSFEAYNASNIASYGISTTEGSPGNYTWNIPSLPAYSIGSQYQATTYQIASTSLAVTDLPNSVWLSTFGWDGTKSVEQNQLDLTQTIPTSNTSQTTGDALNAARAQGFGKWVISGTTLTLYAGDGSTVVRTFTLNSATTPTSRT
jgi:hypothetical protein